MKATLGLLACSALALGACGDDAVERGAEGDARTAAGEVRGGTISDAMLPLDTVQSQSPPLRESAPAVSEASEEATDAVSVAAATEPVGEDGSTSPQPEADLNGN